MKMTVRAAAKGAVAGDVAELTLVASDGSSAPRTPGAHIGVSLPGGLKRQYSLCGRPEDGLAYRIAVSLTRDSRRGCRAVHEQLAVGDSVRISTPTNRFILEPAPSHVFFTGGIGITPIRPMVSHCHERNTPWKPHYGGRTRQSMAYATELTDLYGPEHGALYPESETGYIDGTRSRQRRPGAGRVVLGDLGP